MNTLKTLTLIGASVLALSATAASAQMYDGRHVERAYDGRGYDDRSNDGRGYEGRGYRDRGGPVQQIRQRLMRIDRRIDRGIQQGDLNREEAHVARGYYNQVAHRVDMYRVDGYTRWELADIDRRLDSLEARVRSERRDDQYGYGYGSNRR